MKENKELQEQVQDQKDTNEGINKDLKEETDRKWGIPITKDPKIIAKIDDIWDKLKIFD